MTPTELLTQAHALGVSVEVDGPELVLRYKGGLPPGFIEELKLHKPELLSLLALTPDDDPNLDPVACRGCAAMIPAGTTLCAQCGAARSPLVRYALELIELTEERSLRGRALIALDKRRYPRLRIPGRGLVGPGLIAWCPVLRDADSKGLKQIAALADKAGTSKDSSDIGSDGVDL